MNRITCRDCSEIALSSPEPAERLEGLGLHCTHCGTFGRIVLNDDDEGGIGSIELVASESPPLEDEGVCRYCRLGNAVCTCP